MDAEPPCFEEFEQLPCSQRQELYEALVTVGATRMPDEVERLRAMCAMYEQQVIDLTKQLRAHREAAKAATASLGRHVEFVNAAFQHLHDQDGGYPQAHAHRHTCVHS